MNNILHEICEQKRAHIKAQKAHISESALRDKAASRHGVRGFQAALTAKRPGLIAEIKKASPSKGLIREDFDPAELAKAYQAGGAACLSVLTDTPYFQGEDAHLDAARSAVGLPVLRKDFMLDPYQMTESRAIGADCVLLIMAALSDHQAQELEAAAQEWNLDVLVEVHDEDELQRALLHLNSTLIGINNRNLKTLEVDLDTSLRLRAQIPDGYTCVCESGIQRHEDIRLMQRHDIHCFLVGESLMLQRNITEATQALLGTAA